LAFALKTPARWNAVKVAVDVDLEHRRRRIARAADIHRMHGCKTELAEVETLNERIDRAHQIVSVDKLSSCAGNSVL
jgi:hypothetical protein